MSEYGEKWYEKPVGVIQDGNTRVEYVPPDLALAYATLAPVVTEAWAFMKAGENLQVMHALDKAKEIIELATVTAVWMDAAVKNPMPSPNTVNTGE